MLAKWIENGRLSSYWTDYPFLLAQPDRPDFVFSTEARSMGIEVAQITGRASEQARVLAHKSDLGGYHILGPQHHDRTMSSGVLQSHMQNGTGGLFGDEPVRALVEIALRLIDQKVGKSSGYRKLDSLVLLLYDNSSLGVDWDNKRNKVVLEALHERGRNATLFEAAHIYADGHWYPEIPAFAVEKPK